MSLELVIGAPAWDRAWSLPLWFQSVRASVDPGVTGLVFVVPSSDDATRDAIADLSSGFRWVDVLRDQGPQSSRHERPATEHRNLATVRNQILRVVERASPDHYLSWDTDFLVPPGTVEYVGGLGLPMATVWAWLNRQEPRRLLYRPSLRARSYVETWVQDPVCATAMGWWRGAPRHYPAADFLKRGAGVWRTPITLAWQLMDRRAYRVASYAPHPAGEDVGFNRMLAARGVERWCVGEILGLHLYDRARADEIALGWPGVMALAEQAPLAATWRGARPPEYEALGIFPADAIETKEAA